MQYFNFNKGLQYEGERISIVEKFQSDYNPLDDKSANGLISRFIVNYQGQTGRIMITSISFCQSIKLGQLAKYYF